MLFYSYGQKRLKAIDLRQKLANYGPKTNLLLIVCMDCKLRMALKEVCIMTCENHVKFHISYCP